MGKSLLLRQNWLSITVLYEGGGRKQVTIPGSCSGRIQGRKEIPEAMRGGTRRRQIHGKGEDNDNVTQGQHIKGSKNERLKGERMHVCSRTVVLKMESGEPQGVFKGV